MKRKKGERRQQKRWTADEDRTLLMALGAFGIDYIVRQLPGRTKQAVYQRVRTLQGGGGISRGTFSLVQLMRDTGYAETQLRRAQRALGQRWQRTSTHGDFMLSDDQREALIRWLAKDYWCRSTKVYACVYCGRDRTDGAKPHSLGLCRLCHQSFDWLFLRGGRGHLSKRSLLALVESVRAKTDPEDTDWLDAFAASVSSGCVLTRSTLDRLIEAARPWTSGTQSPQPQNSPREGAGSSGSSETGTTALSSGDAASPSCT